MEDRPKSAENNEIRRFGLARRIGLFAVGTGITLYSSNVLARTSYWETTHEWARLGIAAGLITLVAAVAQESNTRNDDDGNGTEGPGGPPRDDPPPDISPAPDSPGLVFDVSEVEQYLADQPVPTGV